MQSRGNGSPETTKGQKRKKETSLVRLVRPFPATALQWAACSSRYRPRPSPSDCESIRSTRRANRTQSLPAVDCALTPPAARVSTLSPRVQTKSQARSIISTEQRWPLDGARAKGEKRVMPIKKEWESERGPRLSSFISSPRYESERKSDSRSGLNPSLDVAAPDLCLQPLDKFATLTMHEIHQLILLPTQHEDLFPFPPIETERRGSGIEFVKRGEERAGEEGSGEGEGTGGCGKVLRAMGEELERRRRTDNGYTKGDARVCNARLPQSARGKKRLGRKMRGGHAP